MCKITMAKVEKLKGYFGKYQKVKGNLERKIISFIRLERKTREYFDEHGIESIGAKKLKLILNTRTSLFRKSSIDASEFFDKHLINDLYSEVVGAEKLEKVEKSLESIIKILDRADSYRNKMRECIEEYNDCDEVEELLDAIESLQLKEECSVVNLEKKLDLLVDKINKEEREED